MLIAAVFTVAWEATSMSIDGLRDFDQLHLCTCSAPEAKNHMDFEGNVYLMDRIVGHWLASSQSCQWALGLRIIRGVAKNNRGSKNSFR